MFVLSSAQVAAHYAKCEAATGHNGTSGARTLLDIGAGDGHVTQHFAQGHSRVLATEACPVMTWRLQARGYTVLPVTGWAHQRYNTITCLNVLDRLRVFLLHRLFA